MRHDLDTFRRWASALEDDARRCLPGPWSVTVDDSFVLTVGHDGVIEQVLLGDLVDEDAWPAEAWTPPRRELTLEHEASEAMAHEFLEVLRLWAVNWMPCARHRAPGWACSATWLCPGPPFHELAVVGSLPSPRAT